MIKEENQTESKTDKTNGKAPYSSPQLMTYGNVRELTQGSARPGSRVDAITLLPNKSG
jgi:hypothetical protein